MAQATVLVVEDAAELRELYAGCLADAGYRVLHAPDAATMQRLLTEEHPDLVLLDINLPDANGLELARSLHIRDRTGLMFVTVHTDDEDRIGALEDAGDDYVTKPVDPRELLARVRNLLRRKSHDSYLRFDGWTLDLVRRALFRPDGSFQALTTGEFNVLAALAAMRPNPVNREYLLDVISNRDRDNVSEHTVDMLVMRLRRKMRSDDGRPAPIVTVRGVGYALSESAPESD
ncbi:response regulator transcription factor [Azospirillum thermophilum]|uniref:DNA-binding response regulator n=1 Tax=Azospirillum thermophilum TaxID=2202148 RepID=A0A2S2CKN6_9PROT|nr:response regulator transcription factor [Azospirillum thermophilum]AWK84930.1 DNA-binding response regulator [Azospirillum thermophilum]